MKIRSSHQQRVLRYFKAMDIPFWWMELNSSEAANQKKTLASKSTQTQSKALAIEIEASTAGLKQMQAQQMRMRRPDQAHTEQIALLDAASQSLDRVGVLQSQPMIDKGTSIDCSTLAWPELMPAIQTCQQCSLAQSRTQALFGAGDQHAKTMIVLDAPDAEQDDSGCDILSGDAGRLLDNMLVAMGLPQQAVFITHLIKCRPPNNREPSQAEIEQCQGYLRRQMALIQPKVILLMGRRSAQAMLQTNESFAQLRNHVHKMESTQAVVTQSPHYLLRRPREKKGVWQDLQLFRRLLAVDSTLN